MLARLVFTRLFFIRPVLATSLIVGTVCSLTVMANTDSSENAATVEWSDAAVGHHVDADNYTGKLEPEQLKALAQAGKELFRARFTVADGVGRPLATQAIIPTKRKRPPRNEFARTAGLDANACVCLLYTSPSPRDRG